ncbi:MAG TPA: cytochrome c oxidase subunit 3 [Steroidobacteraceae bacterium]|nr:cytochrome c oxidase subunit 3 [Steroidobacteraceae bacterium]
MSGIAEQFEDVQQQEQSAHFGMWVFLATEVLFFGVLFFVYSVMRAQYPADFAAASRHTDVALGTINTAVLLTSSFTIALAVRASQMQAVRLTRRWLCVTAALGAVFLALKGFEYYKDYSEHLIPAFRFSFDAAHARGAEVFFALYFATTGLHAVHLCIGIAVVLLIARNAARNAHAVEVGGLYWHFVDIVWIFLYPLLYLVSRA